MYKNTFDPKIQKRVSSLATCIFTGRMYLCSSAITTFFLHHLRRHYASGHRKWPHEANLRSLGAWVAATLKVLGLDSLFIHCGWRSGRNPDKKSSICSIHYSLTWFTFLVRFQAPKTLRFQGFHIFAQQVPNIPDWLPQQLGIAALLHRPGTACAKAHHELSHLPVVTKDDVPGLASRFCHSPGASHQRWIFIPSGDGWTFDELMDDHEHNHKHPWMDWW